MLPAEFLKIYKALLQYSKNEEKKEQKLSLSLSLYIYIYIYVYIAYLKQIHEYICLIS